MQNYSLHEKGNDRRQTISVYFRTKEVSLLTMYNTSVSPDEGQTLNIQTWLSQISLFKIPWSDKYKRSDLEAASGLNLRPSFTLDH